MRASSCWRQDNGNTCHKAEVTQWKLRKTRDVATSATVVSMTGQVVMSSGNLEEASGRQNPWQPTLYGMMFLDAKCAEELGYI